MDLQVIDIEVIQAKAQEAFDADLSQADCPYVEGTEARDIWLQRYAVLSNRAWRRAA